MVRDGALKRWPDDLFDTPNLNCQIILVVCVWLAGILSIVGCLAKPPFVFAKEFGV